MNKIYKSILGLALIFTGIQIKAQVSAYSFSQLSGAYNAIPISGPTTTAIAVGNQDDNVYNNIPIGFNFNFNGSTYNSIALNVNGWICMGTVTPFSSYTPISTGSFNDVVSFFSRDLQLGPAQSCTTTSGSNVINLTYPAANAFSVGDTITGTGIPLNTTVTAIAAGNMTISANANAAGTSINTKGSISYQLSGVAPNQVFTIQWRRVGRWPNSSTGLDDYISAQIKLYQTTNIVEVIYGNCGTNSATAFTGEVGLRGLSNADFNNRSVTTSYAASAAGTINSATAAFNSTLAPGSGQIYRWTPPNPCAGAPSAGIVSPSSTICPNTTAVVSNTSSNSFTGITYQWMQAPAAIGPWTNVTTGSGFNTQVLTTASLTTLTFYKLVITCTNSAQSVTTAVTSVNPNNPATLCYCNQNLGGSGCTGDNITNVSILGTPLNNSSTCNNSPVNGTYSQFAPAVGTTATLNIGVTYTISVNTTASNIESVWIDYNQSGTFDASEHTQITLSSTANVATLANITIPGTALLGQTGMRVRSRGTGNPNGPTDACTVFGSGETEDYIVTIAAASPCAGAPGANSAVASLTTVCPNGSVTLGLATSYTVGGLTYQWYSAALIAGPYSAISNATTSIYTATNIASTLFYRAVITCTNGPASTTSTPVQVVVSGNPCQCSAYCASNATSNFDDEIFNVSIGSLNNTSSCSMTGGPTSTLNLYSNFTGIVAPPNLIAGTNYTLSVTVGQCNGNAYSGGVTVYMDYNNNGLFTDPGEQVYASVSTLFAVTGTTLSAVITIPASATTGIIRMRAIAVEGGIGTAPCTNYTWGETEDYCVNIVPAVPCSGTPGANAAVASATQVCTGGTSSLSLATSYTVGGLTYQWSTATSSVGPYTAVSGATNTAYTATNITSATWYRCVVTCTNGPASTTATPVQVVILGSPVYATVPFLENFDNAWQNRCDVDNVPVAANWDSNPTTGNESWRRQDDGATALWSSSFGTVTPLAGAGCANFHSYDVFSPNTGNLDLYVNMNLASTYTVSFYYQNGSGSDSLQVFFSNNGGNTYTYQATYTVDPIWNKKTILLPAVSSPSCVLRFLATGDFGADDIGIDSLQIQSACAAPNVTLAASQTTICNGASVSLTASGATTYTWNTSATTSSISVTPSVTSSYTVIGENTPGCPNTKTVTITVKPSPTLSTSAAPGLTVCPGASTTLTAVSSAGNYTWSPGGQNTAAISVTPAISTVYNVVTTNSVGCSTNSNVTVFVVVCTGLAKTTVIDNNTFIYPNPNNGNINVVVENSNGNYTFEIIDLTGKLVYRATLTKAESALNIKELANGMYTYRITSVTTKVAIKQGKLIKE